MVEWRFRDATEDDFEPLLAIRIDVMREHLERVFRYKPSRARRIFREHFTEPGMRAIMIESELAGCVAFRTGADAIKLDSFYLHRRYHNGGLGTTILKVLLAEADATGLPVRLEVLTGSKADRFYLRHGFVKLSEDEIEGEYERPAGGQQISALLPRGQGHQFVVYGDACSGVAGALHESTFASVNAAVRRLTPSPEFILFLGDEIAGYTADADTLRQQWRHWLDHDPVLSKAEVRDSGHGLHVLLWLDEPIIVADGEARQWDDIARGICNALPGDPNLNGIIALTRPIGAVNTKYNPPREVRLLRPGQPVSRAEILDLNQRVTMQPARLWMRLFFGGERVDPCPLCGKESLGVAGYWQCRCYGCGRVNAASLVYRFYSPEFLDSRQENHHG